MPRLARLDAPGVIHHVIIRGIERRRIFLDDTDRDDLVERLAQLLPETRTACYAWALLPNHAHFLFRSGVVSLSTLMGRLLTGYAVRFNHRYGRHGQLFQNRYKSIICQEDAYLKVVLRYIHLNPLRARIVASVSQLKSYRYSGHGVLMGTLRCPWQDGQYVLSLFGNRIAEGRKRYLAYLEEGADQGRRPELVGGRLIRNVRGWEEVKKRRPGSKEHFKGDRRILGDSEFVTQVLRAAEEKFNRYYQLKSLGYDLKIVEKKVCEIYGIERGEIYTGGRPKILAEARGLFCYWAARELGYGLTDLARRLGMTEPGVVYAVRRGDRIVKENSYRLQG